MESNDIFIRDYYLKKLHAAQASDFEMRYADDQDFRLDADRIKAEVLGIRAASRAELKGKFSEWEEEKNRSSIERRFRFYTIMGTAASIALLIGAVIFLLLPSSNQDLYLSYYEPYINYEHTVARDESSDEQTLTDQAYSKYDARQFAQAEKSFSALIKTDTSDVATRFFRAMSRLETNQLSDALLDLDWVRAQQDSYYSEAAHWYMALIYLQQGEQSTCVSTLKALVQQKGSYQEQARKLLEDL